MCTTVSYLTKTNKVFLARNQDFQYEQDYRAVAAGRGQRFLAAAGEPYTARYAFAGICVESPGVNDARCVCTIDGVNEKGLACTQSYFAEFAVYASEQEIREAGKQPVRAELLTTWILANCATVDEAIVCISRVACVEAANPLTGKALPQHFFLRDMYGKCVVFEPDVRCGFTVHDNPVGVMANSPGFAWQMTNLSYYQHLSPDIIPGKVYDGYEMATRKATGQMGLPGDASSPSRFLRAAYYVSTMPAPDSDAEAVAAGLQIASALTAPKGAVGTGNESYYYTQYSAVTDVEAGTVYMRFYKDFSVRRVSLRDYDLSVLAYESCPVSKSATAKFSEDGANEWKMSC